MSPAAAIYRADVPRSVRVLVGAALLLLAAVGVVVLVLALGSPTSPIWLPVLAVAWIAAVVAVLLRVLALPTRVEIGPDGIASFVCPSRIVRVPLSAIIGVRRVKGLLPALLVAHDGGVVRIPGHLTHLGDFVTRVTAASTRAAVVGIALTPPKDEKAPP
jgi:hypothetical protein